MRCVKGLSVVITGAPNLSNEAGVRGEVRSVSEGGSDVWGMRMGELRVICVRTKCWSCRDGTGDGAAR